MKQILIVEDSAPKRAAIASVIQEASKCAIQVSTAASGNGARELLAQKKFDLVVLDLAIPLVEGGNADPNGGVSLLEAIDKTDTLLKPAFILGLTAFDNLYEKYSGQFASRLWGLEVYDPATGIWKARLAAKTVYITTQERNRYQSDVVLITALESPELDAVMEWDAGWQQPVALDETTYVYSGFLTSGKTALAINAVACPRKGMVAASLLTAKMISQFVPRLVLMPGICAGVPKKSDIGDVLVADPCWNWQDGRIEPEDTKFSPHQLDLAPELQAMVRVLARDRDLGFQAAKEFRGEKPNRTPELKWGPIATGSSVIASKSVLPQIAKQNRDLIGAEMEIYGVYAA